MLPSNPFPQRQPRSARLRFCLLSLLMLASPAWAIDIPVDILGDPAPNGCTVGHCSLREAVILANSVAGPDRILLPATPGLPLQLAIPGENENASQTGDLDVLDDLEIVGTGADTTVLVQTVADRVLQTTMANDKRLVLRGLTVQGGSGNVGGGLLTGSMVTIEDAAFVGNSATLHGGALDLYATFNSSIVEPRLVLRRVRFEDNVATKAGVAYGGAIYAINTFTAAPFVLIEDCEFIGNEAESSGGAIHLLGVSNSGGDVTIRRSAFIGNRAGGSGGAAVAVLTSIFNVRIEDSLLDANVTTSSQDLAAGALNLDGLNSAVVLRTTFSSNSGNRGGAVLSRKRLELIDSHLRDNSASLGGGAVWGVSNVFVDSSTFDSNRVTSTTAADDGGGAIGFSGQTLHIQRSTFSGNDAYRGGAIALTSGTLQLYRSTVTAAAFGIAGRTGTVLRVQDDTPGNALVIANSLLAGTCTYPTGRQLAVAYNNIESPGNTCRLGTAGLQGQNQLSATSGQVNLGSLGSNGGPTPTRMPGAGSIAINTGRENYCTASDQRHYARADALCDIGSVEVGATLDELFRHGFE